MKTSERILVVLLLIPVSLYVGWRAFEWYWFAGIIPANIGISHPIAIGGESGFIKGCGAAVFKMSDSTADAISKDGIRFFDGSTHSRRYNDPYHSFGFWRETEGRTMSLRDGAILGPGFGCSSASIKLTNEIDDVMDKPGSYYAFGPEKVILVIPEKRLVVLSYFG